MNNNISDNILDIISRVPDELLSSLAARVKERRLELNLTQQELAGRAGIKLPTYRRFERTGELSLRSLAMLSITLDDIEALDNLFTQKQYQSIDQLIDVQKTKKRLRGGKKNG